MIFKLQQVGDYISSGKAPKALIFIINSFKPLFTFKQERFNRYKRYVKVVKAYKAGKLISDIEKEFECSRFTVLRYARLAGLPQRDKGFNSKIREAVIALYKQKKPIAEISARLGVSQAYISKTATEEGINRRKFKKRMG